MRRVVIVRLLFAALGTSGVGGCALLATLEEHKAASETVEAGPDAVASDAPASTLGLEIATHDKTVPPKSDFQVKFTVTRSGPPSPVTVSVKGTGNVSAPPVFLLASESEGTLVVTVGRDPAVEAARLEVTARSNDATSAPQQLMVNIAGAPGALDATLGGTGIISPDVTNDGDADAFALAVASDGTIVVVGSAPPPSSTQPAFVAMRIRPNGTPDPGFGTTGLVFLPFTATSAATAVALEPSGSMVVAGTTNPGVLAYAVAHLQTSGALDTSFGLGGTIVGGVDGGAVSLGGVTSFDGGIVATGTAQLVDGDHITFVRVSADGGTSLDVVPRGGKPERGAAIVTTSDGHLLTAATRNTSAGLITSRVGLALRSLRDGTPDNNFSTNGTAAVPDVSLNALAEAKGGTVVLAGGMYATGTVSKPTPTMLVKLRGDGTLDPSFGSNGTSITDAGLAATGVAIQSDEKIAAAGSVRTGLGLEQAAVLRFTSSGALDATFGTAGLVPLHGPSTASQASAIAIQPDGRIVVTGFVKQGALHRFFIARLWP